ncbi:MAG TPA: hypothetical protein VJK30_03660 [Coxiellaceae bacterium]|nr:MAG: hypothetical protein A3E81_07100 [Gammaproteobacteria bacterium RIFCSPHIGHO2_12_FULL_36_30]HLB56407.1 hypothetical protein [Coxiellaceae bacterium]
MLKKFLLLIAIFTFTTILFANDIVPCATYLSRTKYANVISKSNHENFFVKRHFHKGISNEQYIFSNGKIIHGQSRVVPGKKICASYAKHDGKYVEYATYSIVDEKLGYLVRVIYCNGDKQKLRVYPVTKRISDHRIDH